MTQDRPHRSLAERFWPKVEKTEGCWLWTAKRLPHGYGLIGIYHGGHQLAHRASWEMHFGPIPAGMLVCHSCDNPPCVRPDHLFLGTQFDNMQDASRKGRATYHTPAASVHRGEAHYLAKLTEPVVREIKRRYVAGGISQDALALEYGVSQERIWSVVRGHTWRHVT